MKSFDYSELLVKIKSFDYSELLVKIKSFDYSELLVKMKRFNSSNILYWLNPLTWIRNYPVDKHWDEHLNILLDDPTFTYDCGVCDWNKDKEVNWNDYSIKINDIPVWVSNYPYAYGNMYVNRRNENLPKRSTVKRLHDIIEKNKRSTILK